ncbi:peptide chain release factor N(5)-glutamine methyltransferase [Skermanella mucosa]|uniref:peptide chain release factor N(5)-glutamine methyltransferase n=1 Tax=Skermanella mucosa TaxID=1789672 RepID=UPI001E34F956|nr:peptide chain release factor N(5)-glutamine methyltransferase [Skermanella mucosa]UEM19703.1 peptide chain release factor N(5)-glutamine methyltransferase [Skermanella mucosa]
MTGPAAPGLSGTPMLREVMRHAEGLLREAGIDTPDLDARLLTGAALGMTREHMLIHATARLNQPQVGRVLGFVARRVAREPVSRILGRREFWSLDFTLSPATLDPRPDSETVVEEALAGVADRQAPLSVLDLGTGTGCLLLAILSELPQAAGLGIDRSEEAVETAAANARRLGLGRRARFAAGDWALGIEERFDLVISNPPYIPDGDIDALAPEVTRFDPAAALAGGPDGLDAYRAIVAQLPGVLKPGGRVILEVGFGQSTDVSALLGTAGFGRVGARKDLGGVERVVFGHLGA